MIYKIVCPILGFEKIKKIELKKMDETFAKLTTVENQNISFTIVNPFSLREYDIVIPDNYQELLKLDDKSEVFLYNIMILQNPIQNSTINFLAPLVFNKTQKLMGQIILDSNKYKNYSIIDKISNYLSKS